MATLTKPRFFFLSVKRNILSACFCLFTLLLVLFSQSNLTAAKSGLQLWANHVLPSLLPFFIATELLSYTNVVVKIGEVFNWCMRPLFNVPGCGAYALIMGIISGYPVGAKIVTRFYEEGLCTKEEGERLLSFTNNSGPLFIIGSVGILMYRNTMIGILLFITHLLASLSVGFIFRFWKRDKHSESFSHSTKTYLNKNNIATLANLGEILSDSIVSSIKSVLVIGGFVVIFSSIISILKSSGLTHFIEILFTPFFNAIHIDSSFIEPIFTGFFEITNGISNISNIACKRISINILLSN